MQVDDSAVHMLRVALTAENLVLSRDPAKLANGRNSLYQVMNLAALAGARRQVLLGADGKAAGDGRKHSVLYGEHPDRTPDPGALETNLKHFRLIAPELACDGVEVLNASPGTAIDAFKKVDLCHALTA